MHGLELPGGTVAFLFTDLQGSTRLWQAHPDAMPRAYERHDAILRTAAARHGGTPYKVVGDAFQIAFATVPEAVATAFAAQRQLVAEDWGGLGLPEPLRVRMALHAGALEPDRHGDYRSPVLNRLGRLLAAGHGGQILLSRIAFELARDHLPEGTELRDLGERRLKDLYRPEHIYQLTGPGLPGDFPPLATLDRRPHNLPVQPTPLIGREREIAAVRQLLERRHGAERIQLVTLTGPGGTGKTRLGLQIAAELVDVFGGGAFWVPLAAIRDPALVIPAVATTLGVQQAAGQPLLEAVKDNLQTQELMLLLDNFEQVTEAAPDIAELLAACPSVKVLVTSRTALRLRAEREFPVPPLRLPDPRRLPPLEQLSQYEAVRLFIERAVAVKPDFAVTNLNAPAVAGICHRLDGLPLAIELAAARSKLLAPEALLARLDQRLKVLTGGARDLPARQQTLRGAIAWSHDLLSREEQTLFRRLGVFVGGCSVEAAEAVCDPAGELDLLDGLASLVDKSLLRPDEGPDAETRVTMLETILEFAQEQLAASDEGVRLRRAHARHYRALVEEAAPETWGAGQAGWLDRLEGELGNLRAALAWSIEQRDAVTALTLGISLEKLWDVRGYLAEGLRWLERGLALPMEGVQPGTQAQAHSNAGSLAQALGDLERAWSLQERALAILRELDSEGGRRGTAHTLNRMGIVAFLQGDHDRADALQQDALARFREQDDASAVATVLNNLGVTADDRGDFARARALYEEALALEREAGDTQSIAIYLGNIGEVALSQGDLQASAAAYREAIDIWAALRDQWNTTATLDGVSMLAAAGGMWEPAARLCAAAGAMRDAVGIPLLPNERASIEPHLTTVRDTLGAEAFASAWDAGRELTLASVLAEALAVTDAIEAAAGA